MVQNLFPLKFQNDSTIHISMQNFGMMVRKMCHYQGRDIMDKKIWLSHRMYFHDRNILDEFNRDTPLIRELIVCVVAVEGGDGGWWQMWVALGKEIPQVPWTTYRKMKWRLHHLSLKSPTTGGITLSLCKKWKLKFTAKLHVNAYNDLAHNHQNWRWPRWPLAGKQIIKLGCWFHDCVCKN